jgi:hypothetical protein
MSKKAYNWLTNVAIILGVAGALLYDSPRVPHFVSIALAVIAGLLAAGVYLCNQFLRTKAAQTEKLALDLREDARLASAGVGKSTMAMRAYAESQIERAHDTVMSQHRQAIEALVEAEMKLAAQREVANRQKGVLLILDGMDVKLEQTKRAASFMDQFLEHSVFARGLRYNLEGEKSLLTPEVELSPMEAALCITDIIRHVSSDPRMKGLDYRVDQHGLHLSQGRQTQRRGHHVEMHMLDLMIGQPHAADEEDLEEEKA